MTATPRMGAVETGRYRAWELVSSEFAKEATQFDAEPATVQGHASRCDSVPARAPGLDADVASALR